MNKKLLVRQILTGLAENAVNMSGAYLSRIPIEKIKNDTHDTESKEYEKLKESIENDNVDIIEHLFVDQPIYNHNDKHIYMPLKDRHNRIASLSHEYGHAKKTSDRFALIKQLNIPTQTNIAIKDSSLIHGILAKKDGSDYDKKSRDAALHNLVTSVIRSTGAVSTIYDERRASKFGLKTLENMGIKRENHENSLRQAGKTYLIGSIPAFLSTGYHLYDYIKKNKKYKEYLKAKNDKNGTCNGENINGNI